MDPAQASVDFTRSSRGLTALIRGELDASSAPPISDLLSAEASAEDGTVWLEMSGVSFCGSIGVSLILRAELEASERGGRMILLNPSPAVLRVLEMCNLSNRLRIRIG